MVQVLVSLLVVERLLLIFISVAKLFHHSQVFVLLGKIKIKIHSTISPHSNTFTLVTNENYGIDFLKCTGNLSNKTIFFENQYGSKSWWLSEATE